MRMNLSLAVASCLSVLALGNASVAAQDASPGPVDGHEIMQLQQQIAILEQQLKVAQLQKQIREAAAKDDDASKAAAAASSPQAPMPLAARAAPAVAPSNPPPAPPPLPQIVSISGAGNHLTAILLLPTGGQVVAYPAMGLPGGLTVHDVGPNGVHVMSGGELVDLPFEGSGPAPVSTQAPSAAPSFIQLPASSPPSFAPPPGPAVSR